MTTLPEATPQEMEWVGEDPLAALPEVARRHGPFVRFETGRRCFHLANSPELIRAVLTLDHRKAGKVGEVRHLREFFGSGLINADPEAHLAQRRRMVTAFRRQRLGRLRDRVKAQVWRAVEQVPAGRIADLHQLSRTITLRVLLDVILGMEEVPADSPLGQLPGRPPSPFVGSGRIDRKPPLWQRLWARLGGGPKESHDRAFDEALRAWLPWASKQDCVMGDLAAELEPEALRDEAATLLVAGSETTSSALTFACYMLDAHPEQARTLRATRDPWTEGPPDAALRFFLESLRIYPPVWRVGRVLLQETKIGEHLLPPGSGLWVSPWVTHRDETWFPQPLDFRPERFEAYTPGSTDWTFLPFGGGGRSCLGELLALWIGVETVTAMAWRGRWRWKQAPPLLPHFTLVPARPAEVYLEPGAQ